MGGFGNLATEDLIITKDCNYKLHPSKEFPTGRRDHWLSITPLRTKKLALKEKDKQNNIRRKATNIRSRKEKYKKQIS